MKRWILCARGLVGDQWVCETHCGAHDAGVRSTVWERVGRGAHVARCAVVVENSTVVENVNS